MLFFEWVQWIEVLYYFLSDDHSSVLYFFRFLSFLFACISHSVSSRQVYGSLRCSPALSLCPVLSRWPAAVLLYFIPLSSAPLLLLRVQ